MAKPKPWSELTVEEKLEMLRHEMQLHQRQCSAMAKTLEELGRRADEIERRFEGALLD
jgi:hypothetical protein